MELYSPEKAWIEAEKIKKEAERIKSYDHGTKSIPSSHYEQANNIIDSKIDYDINELVPQEIKFLSEELQKNLIESIKKELESSDYSFGSAQEDLENAIDHNKGHDDEYYVNLKNKIENRDPKFKKIIEQAIINQIKFIIDINLYRDKFSDVGLGGNLADFKYEDFKISQEIYWLMNECPWKPFQFRNEDLSRFNFVFESIISSQPDVFLCAPRKAILPAYVAKFALEKLAHSDSKVKVPYFSFTEYKMNGDNKEIGEEEIFNKLIENFKEVIRNNISIELKEFTVELFDESVSGGTTMRNLEYIVLEAWKQFVDKNDQFKNTKLKIVKGPYIYHNQPPYLPTIIDTPDGGRDGKLSKISKERINARRNADAGLAFAHILGEHLANSWSNINNMYDLAESERVTKRAIDATEKRKYNDGEIDYVLEKTTTKGLKNY